jgi:hypothetical protein
LGWSFRDYCLLIEEIAAADPSLALALGSHNSLCCLHILLYGSAAQQAHYLPLLASGKWIGSWSLTEDEAGSDAAALQTRARRNESGWVLNGVKKFTTNAAFSKLNIVLATTDGSRRGITAFLVQADNPGRKLGERIHTMGVRASQTYEVIFEDCKLPPDALLGEEGEGLFSAMKMLDSGRLSLAAWALGVARGAYEDALAYAKSRKQFGKPLLQIPAVREMLVDMRIAMESSRALVEKAVDKLSAGEDFTSAATLAKLAASQAAVRAADLSLQVHGGNGYVAGSRPEKYYRDARLGTIGEGTSEVLRLILARELYRTQP